MVAIFAIGPTPSPRFGRIHQVYLFRFDGSLDAWLRMSMVTTALVMLLNVR